MDQVPSGTVTQGLAWRAWQIARFVMAEAETAVCRRNPNRKPKGNFTS